MSTLPANMLLTSGMPLIVSNRSTSTFGRYGFQSLAPVTIIALKVGVKG